MNRVLLCLLFSSWIPMVFVSCSGSSGRSSGYNPDIGPFDSNGNYVEAWADNPPKRRSKRRTQKTKPVPVAPLPKPSWEIIAPLPKVAKLAPLPQPRPAAVAQVKPKPKYTKPKPKYTKPKPRPKPIKIKPRVAHHRVKKGDTLYGLSRTYGTTVSKIQKVNGLSGTLIRNGTLLVIPLK